MKMKFSKKGKIVIILLGIILNFIIRIPSLSHSYGADSFSIRSITNSIALFGEARYWLHPLSIGGFYPYSYASASPFLLAGVKELTGLLGLLSFFTASLLANEILKSDFYRYIVAILYSISQAILVFTTWDISTRGLFIVLLPLFLFILIKINEAPIKYIVLMLIFLPVLAVTHHYFWFTIPMIFGFLFLKVLLFIINRKDLTDLVSVTWSKRKSPFVNAAFLVILLVTFLTPFFSYFFITGSKYAWIINIIKINARYSGPLVILGVGGFGYLLLKKKRSFNEWLILLIILGLAPLVYNATYSHFVNAIFVTLIIGYAFNNLARSYERKNGKIFRYTIIFFLVSSVLFSSFYQHYRTGTSRGFVEWYMMETTYNSGLWVEDYIPQDKILIGNGGVFNSKPARMYAVSNGLPRILTGQIPTLDLMFINKSLIKVEKTDPLSTSFFQDNPYLKVEPPWSLGGRLNWMVENIRDVDGDNFLNAFKVSYVAEDTRRFDSLSLLINETENPIYSNGRVKIWNIKE
jgi:hypothetical protein